MSFQHTSRFIGPVVRWLFPHAGENTVHAVIFAVRKCAHLTEYAFLASLSWLALKTDRNSGGWSWRRARNALLIVTMYAITDELHQSFVPSREGSVWDVLLDAIGGAFGLLFLWILGRWRKLW